MSEKLTEALLNFADAVENAALVLKQSIGEKAEKKSSYDLSKIKWERAEGSAGPYERSEDVNNPEFKELLKDLAQHQGKLTRNGYFIWTFQNGTTVGRKKRKY